MPRMEARRALLLGLLWEAGPAAQSTRGLSSLRSAGDRFAELRHGPWSASCFFKLFWSAYILDLACLVCNGRFSHQDFWGSGCLPDFIPTLGIVVLVISRMETLGT